MTESHTSVQITADGLIALRADNTLMQQVGASDPYASWFVTGEGRQLATFALEMDPVYAVFNLARYRWFSERLAAAVARFSQFVVLGAGYDTRPLHMESFRRSPPRVFEVDVASTLRARRRVLEDHGVDWPEWVVQVPCTIGVDDVNRRLLDAGFLVQRPSFVMAEGLFYYLDAEAIVSLVSPESLGLATGSTVQFDFWTDERLDRLNEGVFARRGVRLFKTFPLPQEDDRLAAALTGRGYGQVEISLVDTVAREYWPMPHEWGRDESWKLVAAMVFPS